MVFSLGLMIVMGVTPTRVRILVPRFMHNASAFKDKYWNVIGNALACAHIGMCLCFYAR
jgi:hypothetical protein